AVLSAGKLNKLSSAFQEAFSAVFQETSLTSAQVRTLHADLDIFIDNNAAAINSAITQPVRGLATPIEKSAAFMGVVLARYAADNPEGMEFVAQYVRKLADIAQA
ncbi:hypothetical protein PZC41_14280, partial [Staphylococcus aureus]|uniref:hypothetical protein n=1 Tax=Staphylococcus aureus TaxID=1280 RepID=UPI0023AF8448